MSNSSLATWKWNGSSDHYNIRDHAIDRITIHHMAGNGTLAGCCSALQSHGSSTNYCIDSNGTIGVMIDEKYRAWTSSNRANDMRAVTIEVANAPGAGEPDWKVTDKALEACIKLCADICKRNGIKQLNYTGDTTGNMTMHKWFCATGCPGPYLSSKYPYIASEVNKRLKGGDKPTENDELYRVRKTWSDSKSQIGAYKNLDAAKKACKKGYKVFDSRGKVIYDPAADDKQHSDTTYKVKVTVDALNIRAGAGVEYKIVGCIRDKGVYTITSNKTVSGQTWGKLKSGAGWICLTGFTTKV